MKFNRIMEHEDGEALLSRLSTQCLLDLNSCINAYRQKIIEWYDDESWVTEDADYRSVGCEILAMKWTDGEITSEQLCELLSDALSLTYEEIQSITYEGYMDMSFDVGATDKLIDIVNSIRLKKGYTDLVSCDFDNEVYYNFYLVCEDEVRLEAVCNHGEKDDYEHYEIPLTGDEKILLLVNALRYLDEQGV